jgi:ABC-type lipoprotein export system ATPase subunit
MLLELRTVSKTFTHRGKAIHAMRDVSLELSQGQFIAVQGKSGCGKSTLLLTAGGMLTPDSGEVVLEGRDLYALPSNQRAAVRSSAVGFVFQQFHLIPYLTVRDNVLAARIGSNAREFHANSRADELLERLGLSDRTSHRPGQLSTGERQRTALARALFNRPKLLLADEPTGNLDAENAGIVLRHLQEFAAEDGAVLLVTHDIRAAQTAQQVWTMDDGILVSSRSLSNPFVGG